MLNVLLLRKQLSQPRARRRDDGVQIRHSLASFAFRSLLLFCVVAFTILTSRVTLFDLVFKQLCRHWAQTSDSSFRIVPVQVALRESKCMFNYRVSERIHLRKTYLVMFTLELCVRESERAADASVRELLLRASRRSGRL